MFSVGRVIGVRFCTFVFSGTGRPVFGFVPGNDGCVAVEAAADGVATGDRLAGGCDGTGDGHAAASLSLVVRLWSQTDLRNEKRQMALARGRLEAGSRKSGRVLDCV